MIKQSQTHFGDDEAGVSLNFSDNVVSPGKITAWEFFPQSKIICQMFLKLFSISHPLKPAGYVGNSLKKCKYRQRCIRVKFSGCPSRALASEVELE